MLLANWSITQVCHKYTSTELSDQVKRWTYCEYTLDKLNVYE